MPQTSAGYWAVAWLVAQAAAVTTLVEQAVAADPASLNVSMVSSCVAGSILGGMIATGKRVAETRPHPMRVELIRFGVNVGAGVLCAPFALDIIGWLHFSLTPFSAFGATGFCSAIGWMTLEVWQDVSPRLFGGWLKGKGCPKDDDNE